MNLDGKQLQELLDQVRQRATAAEEALEAAEERSEKYRAMIDEANIELNQFKEKVCFQGSSARSSDQSRFRNSVILLTIIQGIQNAKSNRIVLRSWRAIALSS